MGLTGTILAYNLYTYCENNTVNRIDPSGHSSKLTYSGITATKTNVGFDVKNNWRFILKTFCISFAKQIIKVWGVRGKYCNMDYKRIAKELFGHEVLFVVGVVIGTVSILKFINWWTAKTILDRIVDIVLSAIGGYVSHYLISKTITINVNYDEPLYRETAYSVIWSLLPPYGV